MNLKYKNKQSKMLTLTIEAQKINSIHIIIIAWLIFT